jgi:lysine biosynthesis protein LysW
MSLITVTCPECGERIQLNEEKEFGFCMNCGHRIEVASVKPPVKKETPKEPEIPEELKETYEKAKAGDVNAQYELGNCYMTGKIVHQDFEQALIWLHKAADQGEPFAMYNIGILYSCGHGVKQNCSKAQLWFAKANEHGLIDRINEAKAKQKSQ